MASRLSPFRTDMPVPTGLMILAGILSLFVPMIFMVPISLALENPVDAPPPMIEFFIYTGWIPGLVALPFALVPAYFANRDGINGWLPTILGGAVFGAIASILMGGHEPGFLALSVALGVTYAATFWALAHGMAHVLEQRAGR